MKQFFQRPLLLALSLLLSLSLHGVEDPQLKKILNAHVEAMGGWRAWNKVESIRLTGIIERDSESVDFCIIKKRPNQIRATIPMPIPGNEEEFVQLIRAHDGKEAWTATRIAGGRELNQQPLDEIAASELLEESILLPRLVDLWQNGAQLDLLPSTSKENIEISAKSTDKDIEHSFILDRRTYYVVECCVQQNSQGTTRSKYKSHGSYSDIVIPTEILISTDQTGDTVMSVATVEIGVGIYDDYFSMETNKRSQTSSL